MQQGNDLIFNSQYSYFYPHSYNNTNPIPNHNPSEVLHSNQSHPSSTSAPPHSHFSSAELSEPNPLTVPYPHLPSNFPYDPYYPSANYAGYSFPNSNQNPTFVSSYPLIENSYIGAGVHDVEGFYGKKLENDFGYNEVGEGVYAYEGGSGEPSRGTGLMKSSSSCSWSGFDDYGRSVGFSSSGNEQLGRVVRAEPKTETQHDARNGLQKFRVKLLAESAGQTTMDVLCQVGLDGLHMIDPSSSRTLRIYPLANLTKWEVMDSSIFAIWAKSSVDIEPRRIRLQSNSYTTNTMLNTVTAAIVQRRRHALAAGLQKGEFSLMLLAKRETWQRIKCRARNADRVTVKEVCSLKRVRLKDFVVFYMCAKGIHKQRKKGKGDTNNMIYNGSTTHDLRPLRPSGASNTLYIEMITVQNLEANTKLRFTGEHIGNTKLKEICGTSEASKQSEQTTEKKGFGDWMNLIKPHYEEKDHWVPDEAVGKCTSCGINFGAFVRRHHCRNCGDIFCDKCSQGRIALTADEQAQPVRVCNKCMEEVTRRLNIGKESGKSYGSHEVLARKLQEEMNRKRRTLADTKPSSDGLSSRMREVACPTCTVLLQVPTSCSETIECGICQHPFIVITN